MMNNELVPAGSMDLSLVEGGLDEDTLAVAGSSNYNKRISIKGSVFRKIVGGKEVGAIDERYMNIIFVKLAHSPSRTYYNTGYVEGAKIGPTCWSNDSKVPDSEVRGPQASSCDKCQWSVKGTGQNGKGTACRLSWRTAVVLPNDPSGDVMQLVIPAASCFGDEDSGRWPFRAYVQMLANHNISAGRVITKMSFDTKAPAPRILFNPVSAVPPEDVSVVASQSKSTSAENAIKLTVFQNDEGKGAIIPDVAQPAPAFSAVPDAPEEGIPEPVLRKMAEQAPAPEKDVSDVIKKWSKKK